MGWFDEQIRERKAGDQSAFEDSIFAMAGAVLGRRAYGELNNDRIVTKEAIDDVLKYYHLRPEEIPASIEDEEGQLDAALRPHGIMYRDVDLEKGWYKDAFGPMIGYLKEDHRPVALIPNTFGGYLWTNMEGRRVRMNRRDAELLDKRAICFYRPLPLKQIGITDLLNYIRSCLTASDMAIIVGLSILTTLVSMLLPNLTRFLSGFVVDSGNTSLLFGTAIFLICVAFSSQLISVARDTITQRIDYKTSLSVEAAMMMRLMSLPAPFFRKFSSGELANRIGAVNQLCTLIVSSLFSTGLTAVISLLYIGQIFSFAPGLAIPSLAIIGATTAVMLLTTGMQRKLTRQELSLAAKGSGLSYALITGVQKIRLSGAEKRAFSRWAAHYAEEAAVQYNPPLFIKISETISLAVSLVGIIVLYALAVETGVEPAEYMAFNTSYGMVMGAFTSLSTIATSVAMIRPILELAEPVLQEVPEVSETRENVTRITGGIELNNVYFRYNERMPFLLNGVNLKVKPGEYIAIVGQTGCGKSTLMRLLLGFEKPVRGAVYFDGRDIERLDLRSLRQKIGVVTQTGQLTQGSIYENIVLAAPWLTEEDAWEAAEMAGIADDIRAMPMGMHTMISEGQGGISGGQRQRIMIARAVVSKPRVLMFDEATSALDNKTQKMISDSLDAMKCTRIVIAHRLSTIRHCDRILVLKDGKIVEDGNYEELMALNGRFADLARRQRIEEDYVGMSPLF